MNRSEYGVVIACLGVAIAGLLVMVWALVKMVVAGWQDRRWDAMAYLGIHSLAWQACRVALWVADTVKAGQ